MFRWELAARLLEPPPGWEIMAVQPQMMPRTVWLIDLDTGGYIQAMGMWFIATNYGFPYGQIVEPDALP